MYYIITKNYIQGFHRWPDAPDGMAYLSNLHRHIFHITCKIKVTHDDREIEIINMQNRIERFLINKYGCADSGGSHIIIEDMSCEMLAHELAEVFSCEEVTVLEDGQGGAMYVRE